MIARFQLELKLKQCKTEMKSEHIFDIFRLNLNYDRHWCHCVSYCEANRTDKKWNKMCNKQTTEREHVHFDFQPVRFRCRRCPILCGIKLCRLSHSFSSLFCCLFFFFLVRFVAIRSIDRSTVWSLWLFLSSKCHVTGSICAYWLYNRCNILPFDQNIEPSFFFSFFRFVFCLLFALPFDQM